MYFSFHLLRILRYVVRQPTIPYQFLFRKQNECIFAFLKFYETFMNSYKKKYNFVFVFFYFVYLSFLPKYDKFKFNFFNYNCLNKF